MQTENSQEIMRLKWACRRGMLELDVLLGNFLEDKYVTLSEADKKNFIALLETPDPELFDVLMGRAQFTDANLMNIVEAIRNHAQKRI